MGKPTEEMLKKFAVEVLGVDSGDYHDLEADYPEFSRKAYRLAKGFFSNLYLGEDEWDLIRFQEEHNLAPENFKYCLDVVRNTVNMRKERMIKDAAGENN